MANLHQMVMGMAFKNAIESAASERTNMQELAQYAQKQAMDRIEQQKQFKIETDRIAKRKDHILAGREINTNANRYANLGLEEKITVKTDEYGREVVDSVWSTPSGSSEATRIKTQREIEESQGFQQAVQSGMDSREIARQFPSLAKEIKELESLGVIGPQDQQSQTQISSIDEYGSVIKPQQVASQDGGQGVIQGDSVVTERTAQGRPNKVISRSGKLEEGKIKTIGEIQKTQLEESAKSIRSFNRVKSATQGIVSAAKRIVKEQGGFGLIHQIKGKAIRTAAKTGLFKMSSEQAQAGQAELRGQLRETVLSLSPILTNQNRVIQGVIDMLAETLPKPGEATTGTEFTAQLKQTTKNAYKLSKALSTGALSEKEITDLNNANPEEVRRRFGQILNKSSWTQQDEKDFEEEWQEIISVPATVPEDMFGSGGQSNLKSKYGLR